MCLRSGHASQQRPARPLIDCASLPTPGPAGVGVSASVGIAIGVHPQTGWRDLVARADTLLYRAKSEGRGRAAV